ncbi:MAG: ATP synthase F0 subunit B [Lachnospiraceae bacterium]|nr:ATP synthase F0 subunit B [Lachnospiraceae bacterium]
MNLPLNIDWQQILLHLFNFVLLFAILYFLLYQPVKEFMDKRTQYYKKIDDDAKSNFEESKKTKEEYENKLASVDVEISARNEKARKEQEESKARKIKEAEKEAEKIIKDAHETLEKERVKMLKEAQDEISDMVVSVTEKIVLQASTSESYEQFLTAVEKGEKNE